MSTYQIVNAIALAAAALVLFVMSRLDIQVLDADGRQARADFVVRAFGIMAALAAYGAVHLVGSLFVG